MTDVVRKKFERTHTCPSRMTLTEWEGFKEGYTTAHDEAKALVGELLGGLTLAGKVLHSEGVNAEWILPLLIKAQAYLEG